MNLSESHFITYLTFLIYYFLMIMKISNSLLLNQPKTMPQKMTTFRKDIKDLQSNKIAHSVIEFIGA